MLREMEAKQGAYEISSGGQLNAAIIFSLWDVGKGLNVVLN